MLPFSVKRLLGAVTEHYGTLLAGNDGLKVVFKDNESEEPNLLEVDIQSVLIPWAEVASLTLDKGLTTTRVKVQLTSERWADELTFLEKGEMVLTIRSKDIGLVDPFLRDAEARRRGQPADDTDDFIDEMRDFLWDL